MSSLLRIFRNILLFCGLFVMIACYRDVDLKLPETERKIVVNALFTADSLITVSLYWSKSPYEPELPFSEEAEVVLITPDGRDTMRRKGKSEFESNVRGEAGAEYGLEIYMGQELVAVSRDRIPERIRSYEMSSFKDSIRINEDGEYYSGLKVSVDDPEDEENFYEIHVRQVYMWGEELTVSRRSGFSDDPVIRAENIPMYIDGHFVVFSDRQFNGQQKELWVYYYPPMYSNNNLVDPDYYLIVDLYSVSENYYQYRKKIVDHLAGQDEDFLDASGEPVPMISNIEGGYGIFAGYTGVSDTIFKQR